MKDQAAELQEVPRNIGELSRYALQEAVERVDRELRDAPQEVRDAISIIRLVVNVPRQAPWYGVQIDADDSSVSVGVMMRNAFEAVGDHIDVPTSEGLRTKADLWFTKLYLPRWRQGKREYMDYLHHLTDPERWERDESERLSREQAQALLADSRQWLDAQQRPKS